MLQLPALGAQDKSLSRNYFIQDQFTLRLFLQDFQIKKQNTHPALLRLLNYKVSPLQTKTSQFQNQICFQASVNLEKAQSLVQVTNKKLKKNMLSFQQMRRVAVATTASSLSLVQAGLFRDCTLNNLFYKEDRVLLGQTSYLRHLKKIKHQLFKCAGYQLILKQSPPQVSMAFFHQYNDYCPKQVMAYQLGLSLLQIGLRKSLSSDVLGVRELMLFQKRYGFKLTRFVRNCLEKQQIGAAANCLQQLQFWSLKEYRKITTDLSSVTAIDRLRQLTLIQCTVSGQQLQKFVKLQYLALKRCMLKDIELCFPVLKQLRQLKIKVKGIQMATLPPKVTILSLSTCALTPRKLKKLIKSGWLNQVQCLDVSHNPDIGMQTVVQLSKLPCITSLKAYYCELDLQSNFQSFQGSKVKVLGLDGNHFIRPSIFYKPWINKIQKILLRKVKGTMEGPLSSNLITA